MYDSSGSVIKNLGVQYGGPRFELLFFMHIFTLR